MGSKIGGLVSSLVGHTAKGGSTLRGRTAAELCLRHSLTSLFADFGLLVVCNSTVNSTLAQKG